MTNSKKLQDQINSIKKTVQQQGKATQDYLIDAGLQSVDAMIEQTQSDAYNNALKVVSHYAQTRIQESSQMVSVDATGVALPAAEEIEVIDVSVASFKPLPGTPKGITAAPGLNNRLLTAPGTTKSSAAKRRERRRKAEAAAKQTNA